MLHGKLIPGLKRDSSRLDSHNQTDNDYMRSLKQLCCWSRILQMLLYQRRSESLPNLWEEQMVQKDDAVDEEKLYKSIYIYIHI